MSINKRWVIVATATDTNGSYAKGTEYFVASKCHLGDTLLCQTPDGVLKAGWRSKREAMDHVAQFNDGGEKYGRPWKYKIALIAWDCDED